MSNSSETGAVSTCSVSTKFSIQRPLKLSQTDDPTSTSSTLPPYTTSSTNEPSTTFTVPNSPTAATQTPETVTFKPTVDNESSGSSGDPTAKITITGATVRT